jgi:hypothetical protein
MRRVTAVILLVLFSLGAFGVSITQHFCSCTEQEERHTDQCGENCCEENEDCCDEIVSKVEISKEYNSQSSKVDFELSALLLPTSVKYCGYFSGVISENKITYSSLSFFPPPKDFQNLYSSFLI